MNRKSRFAASSQDWTQTAMTKRILLAWLAVVVAVFAGFVFFAAVERRQVIERAGQESRLIASRAAAHADRIFEGMDMALVALETLLKGDRDWARGGTDRKTWQILRRWADTLPVVPRLLMADADGRIVLHSDVFPAPSLSLSDRDYFRRHRDEAKDSSILGDPVIGRISGQLVLTLSRRLSSTDGSFNGVVVANISPKKFEEFYGSLVSGPRSRVLLVRADGAILTHIPVTEGVVGTRLDLPAMFPGLAVEEREGLNPAISDANGTRRIAAFHRLDRSDAYTVAELSVDDVLVDWRRSVWRTVWTLTFSFAGLTLLLVLLIRQRANEILARQSQAESESRFRALFETMAQGVVYQAADGRIISANPAAERILGVSIEQMRRRTSLDPRWRTIHEDGSEFPGDQHPSMAALRTGKPVHDTIMGVFHPSLNEYRWILINAVPECRPGEMKPHQAYSTFTDITESKRAEEEIELRNQELITLNRLIAKISSILDSQAILRSALDEALLITGMEGGTVCLITDENTLELAVERNTSEATRHDMRTNPIHIGECLCGRSVVERKPLILRTRDEVLRFSSREAQRGENIRFHAAFPIAIKEKPYGVLCIFTHTDNKPTERSLKLLETFASQLSLSLENAHLYQQRQNHVAELENEITERRKTEQSRRESEERFKNVFNSANEGILIADTETKKFIMGNKTICSMLQYDEAEIKGIGVLDIHPEKDLPYIIEQFDKQTRKEIEIVHLPVKRKDGSVFYADVNASPIVLGGKNCLMGMFRDMTEQRKLEEQLRQSQKMESIGTLAGGVAHDFNNILTAISGYCYLTLMKMATGDPHRANIQQILESVDRAAHLTKDLLLFSRKQPIARKPVDLNENIHKLGKFLARIIGEDIAFKTTLSGGAISVLADSNQIDQVLMNLATNARDAMPKGGVFTITTEQVLLDDEYTTTHNLGMPGKYALISVSDTGQGMDEETRQRIFEPFFTTKEVGKGTGLGLSVVYGIVKQHDGVVNVYSEPGHGTTFKIYLPVVAPGMAEGTEPGAEEQPVGGTETILLAEDDKTVREMTFQLLQDCGYTVITAVDGEDAVKKFSENKDRVQLLLFDLIMPGKSGKDAYDEIRLVRPDIKVIFASGYDPDMVRQKALLEQHVPVVYKPVPPAMLLKKIRVVLDNGSA
jgi:PAS domain S-box-containing protein